MNITFADDFGNPIYVSGHGEMDRFDDVAKLEYMREVWEGYAGPIADDG
jgi:hypothetical protein